MYPGGASAHRDNEEGCLKKPHFLIDLIPTQADIFQLFVAHLLQNSARLLLKPPFFDKPHQQYETDKWLSCPVLVKFHPLPPHLARGFIFTDLGVRNTDSQNTFL
jgi:hypothetical protein